MYNALGVALQLEAINDADLHFPDDGRCIRGDKQLVKVVDDLHTTTMKTSGLLRIDEHSVQQRHVGA